MSSLASQHGALSFIDEGSTRRKEIMAKFLDLEMFDKKFKLAKEDSIDAKVLLKKHEDREYDSEIEEAMQELLELRVSTEDNKAFCNILKQELDVLSKRLAVVDEQINSIPSEYLNITLLLRQQKEKQTRIILLEEKIQEQRELIDLKHQKLTKSKMFIEGVNVDELFEKKQQIEALQEDIKNLNEELTDVNKQAGLLSEIPCGDQFPTCRFIKEAHIQVANRYTFEVELEDTLKELETIEPDKVEKLAEQLQKAQVLLQKTDKELSNLKLGRERNKNSKANLEYELREVDSNIEEYNQNKDVIENLEKLFSKKASYEMRVEGKASKIKTCEDKTLELVKRVGSYEQKALNLKEQKQEHIDLQSSYAAYDLLMQCMHPNGIAYDVIKRKIPVINQEIAKILANIVDFEVFFESAGNKLDIFIKHPKHEARPIEMASGAEKTMGAMAIRLALLSVSSLPKGDLFVLDEPGTALDEENMEGFIRILELIKVYFKNVLLISHLDSLKDCVDQQIVIEKKQGYARVNQ
jgi:exonuclease SbcC